MSDEYHTPYPFRAPLTSAAMNAPLGELDQTLVDIAAGDYYLTKVGVGAVVSEASAIMELTSTTKGFLPPRMTTVQRDAIASPAEGLLIWNTTQLAYNYFDGAGWRILAQNLGALTKTVSVTALSATASVNIGSPGGFTDDFQDLILRLRVRSTLAAVTDILRIRFNGDSGANYDWCQIYSAASTTIASNSGDDGVDIIIPAASATAGRFLDIDFHILTYNEATNPISGFYRGALAENTFYSTSGGFQWLGGAAISDIDFQAVGGNMNGQYALYGLGAG